MAEVKGKVDKHFDKRSWVEVNLTNLKENALKIMQYSPSHKLMAVVKANAYGHGAISCVKALNRLAESFAVSTVDEAIEIRKSGIVADILIMGYTPIQRICEVIEYDLIQTVFSVEYMELILKKLDKLSKAIKIHIKIDTGMNRIGFFGEGNQLKRQISRVIKQRNFIVCGVYSHLSCADIDDSWAKDYTAMQVENFFDVTHWLKARTKLDSIHIANSAYSLCDNRLDLAFCNTIRSGIALYGLGNNSQQLKSVMSLKSVVIMRKKLTKDSYVGYGNTFLAKKASSILTVPIGYADGYSRHLSNKGKMYIRGYETQVVGKVCMDQTMLIANSFDCQVGEEVVIFGEKCPQSATSIAHSIGQIDYEIVTSISPRVERVFIE